MKTELIILLFSPLLLLASPKLPDDMHAWAMSSIDCVFREDYRNAEEQARKIVRKYPDHPAGYFFMAAVLDSWMLRFQTSEKESDFYRYCDMAIEKGEKLLSDDPSNDWARFFIGGADGFKGTYEARYERYITAFRLGWKGVSLLMEMASSGSEIVDIQFGIGSYDYWRSAMMKMLWWMPGVDDKRSQGIKKLRNVMHNGVYTKTAAAMGLIDIYNNEKRYSEALELAAVMIKEHPRALVFYWGRAKALTGLGNHEDAVRVYRYILSRVESDALNNHYNAVVCRLAIAKNLMEEKNYDQALRELNTIRSYSLDGTVKKRLDKQLKEANNLRKEASRGR
ncbi:MAG: tetratricopeptide repeat protein [Chitinispirillaceae bacterium]